MPRSEAVTLPFTEILPVTNMDPLNRRDPVISSVSALLKKEVLPVFPFTEKIPFTVSELVISTLPVNICLSVSLEPN